MADRVGQQLGNYHLLRLLGQGAFAEVYLGEHLYLERLAAIKVLHVQMDAETQEQFRREARTIAHLQHPHILQVHDFGIQEQTPYLVMEYTAGGTLRSQYPKGTRLPFEQMLMYVKQIASALDYAHQHRVIHRDVKPDNVLLTAKGEVVLSDFGLAIVQRSLESLSSQALAGTPLYMAPEQIQLHPCAASDQYALGIMVYEWLRGEPPFRGTLYEVVSSHLTQPPPSLCAVLPDLPAAIEDVVFKALAKNPEQRFATAKGFALALERARSVTSPRPQKQVIHHAIPTAREQKPIVREQKYETHVDQQGTTPILLRPSKRKRSVFHKDTRTRILTIIALLVLFTVIGPMIYVATHHNTGRSITPTLPTSLQSTTAVGATLTARASSLTPNVNGTAIAIQQAKDMTATVQAQVKATAGVIQTATTGTVLYQDPLTDGTSTNVQAAQWDQNSNCVFKQDGYHVSVGTDAFGKGQIQGCREDANTYQNFTATVDMSILSGHSGGIIFRLGLKTLGAYSGYLFEVDNQGHYKISVSGNFSTGAGNAILQDWTLAKTLKTGTGTNMLQLIARGNGDLLFYANGSFLTAIQDNTFTQGKLAFLSSSANGGANTEVVYDNLKITALP